MAIHSDLPHHITDDELVRLSAYNPGYQFERTTGGGEAFGVTHGRRKRTEKYGGGRSTLPMECPSIGRHCI